MGPAMRRLHELVSEYPFRSPNCSTRTLVSAGVEETKHERLACASRANEWVMSTCGRPSFVNFLDEQEIDKNLWTSKE
ncbi:hypothetical protein A2V97_02745 [Candidatus Woesebacteria bacterium RBG_16_42_24]|uniref:Uncharacterized protein n=1 Tax=Candidatus Woesebacteria bacterium RBG_16_42_24 TaxID=1802485 RepID=A0A1F7XMS9_9BACT|nr:MAG: hypothetical protein A2V97_02745 [Candidatus Woesebacteria bacterium RBG_16_42_24]